MKIGLHLYAWARILAISAGLIVLVKVGVQIYLQLRNHITPPSVGFLLDWRVRRSYRNISRTLAPLQLTNGLAVVEIGAGTGVFTVPLAQGVGPDGTVCTIELQHGMLVRQARRVRQHAIANAYLHQADALMLPFADHIFDRAVMVALLPMLPDKQRGLHELRRVLKPGGLLLVSEELPEPEYVPLAVTRRWCTRAGFEEVAAYRERWFYSLLVRNPVTTAPGSYRWRTKNRPGKNRTGLTTS